MSKKTISVAIVGLGAIGKAVLRALKDHPVYRVTAVAVRSTAAAEDFLKNENFHDIAVVATAEAHTMADLVVDAAPASAFRDFAEPSIRAGKHVMVISVGALLDNWDLIDLAQSTGATLQVPSGAIAGLDGVQAASVGTIVSAKIITKKPAGSLGSASTEPEQLFSGTVREAFAKFPANVNVAVALSLAGIGPDKTEIEVWADPSLTVNTHNIVVEAVEGSLNVTVANIPSENPKTAFMTGQSIIAALNKNVATLRVGT